MFWYQRFELHAAGVLIEYLGAAALLSTEGREIRAMAFQAAFLLRQQNLSAQDAARAAVSAVLEELDLMPAGAFR